MLQGLRFNKILAIFYLNHYQLRLNEVISNMTTALEKPKTEPAKIPTIYFDVYLSSIQYTGGVVKFDQFRDSSSTSEFDISSGKFKCPIDGLYFFHFYFMSVKNGSIAPGIYVDNANKCGTYAEENYRTHSCAIVTKLTKGQSVYVSGGGSPGIREGNWSGFIGYRISE